MSPGQASSYLAKLPEELDERALAKGVGEAGMESKGGIFTGQNGYPAFLVQRQTEKDKSEVNLKDLQNMWVPRNQSPPGCEKFVKQRYRSYNTKKDKKG